MNKNHPFIPYRPLEFTEEEMLSRSKSFLDFMQKRRSVRDYSSRPVPREIMENLILTASTAPSGAHKQPWTFCLVNNKEIQAKIRIAAEKEEFESYNDRMPKEWLEDLEPLGTDWHKPFLETAPWLVIVFKRVFEWEEGKKKKNYYVNESVGLACGFLLSAIHNAGLVALTHTPSPMNFLSEVLSRPDNERPFLLIPVGYPTEDAQVPDIHRKVAKDLLVNYD